LRKSAQRFTTNKDRVRELQRDTIERFFPTANGQLRYFGLPSSALADAVAWQDLFSDFSAVERGEEGKEWELQHDLELQAFRSGISDRVTQLRGDIDLIIARGKDVYGNKVVFPFDVISLDYSGGLFYCDRKGNKTRLQAIAAVVERQARAKRNFVLMIFSNLDAVDQAEVRGALANMQTELIRYGTKAEAVLGAYLREARDEVRLKLYVPYFVNQAAASNHFHCETQNVIVYDGNKSVRMMAFRFFLSFDGGTQALRSPKERLSQIINKPLLEVIGGRERETTGGMPKLEAPI
jgi:hypothetical protein